MITVTPASGIGQNIDPADMTWVDLYVSDATSPQRGLTLEFPTRCLPHEVRIDYRYTETGVTQETRVTLEVETVGRPALTEEREAALPVGDVPLVTIPPDFGLVDGQGLVAGVDLDGYIYRTTDFQTPSGSGGPTWDRVDTGITETIYSFVVDPFSPGYIDGVGSIDGWIATETDIYRVEDMFGTPSVTSVHTFATTASASSFHWRSIQASFGAYFAEGINPWLLCISYYGDTSGHTGTWATYSLDGGATWATEVQISLLYDSDTPTRFNPIGVYASPKTPGLAYSAAHIESESGEPPLWGMWPDGGGLDVEGPSSVITADLGVASTGGATQDEILYVMVAPPANAKRINLSVVWGAGRTRSGTGSSNIFLTVGNPATVTRIDDIDFVVPSINTANNGAFTVEWNFTNWASSDWPVNSTSIISSPPGSQTDACYIRMRVNATGIGSSVESASVGINALVTEIELDDGTIYAPSDAAVAGFVSTDWGATWTQTAFIQPDRAQAGSIHLPWESNDTEQLAYFGSFDKTTNRAFRLHRSDGGAITDISPGGTFGVNRGPFGVRTYDSNRQYTILAGIGNDTSMDAADDTHGVFYSSDYGDSWATIVTPIADTGAPTNRPAFEAAFGGDDPAVVFIWGPPEYISYTDDGGSTVDSRAGNLSSFSPQGFCGIAGGPES
jgi:hypothetical protein